MGATNENARSSDELERAQAPQRESKSMAAGFGSNDAEDRAERTPSFAIEAQPLLSAGLTLVPLNGKKPVDSRWQTRDYDSAAVVAAAEGRHNVGVRIPRDLLVVDVDPRNGGGESFARLIEDAHLDLSVYPIVRTGGGGLHVYMRLPDGFEAVQSHEQYPGIDFKTSGQVVAPGSIHPQTGKPYVGENMELLPLEVPANEAMLALLKRRARSSAGDGGAHRAGELTPDMLAANLALLDANDFGAGQHDTWLELMMACHHATDGAGREEFIEWSTQAAGYGDHAENIGRRWDSLRAGEGGVTVATLFKRVIDSGGTPVDRDQPENDFEPVAMDSSSSEKAEERWPFLTLEELRALPPPRWLVEGLIQEQTIAAIYGAPEAGKSFLAIDLIMSVASGRPWHGRAVTQGPVLYIAAEGALGLNRRIQAWKIDRGVGDAPFRLMRSSLNLTSPKEAAAFCQAMAKLGPLSMVVIDTLNQTAAGADENSAQDMGRYIDAMKRMRDASGASVVVIHHSGKDASKGMRGSTALLGAMDTTVEVVRPDEDGMAMHVRVRKQKDAEKEKPIHFEMAKLADSLVLKVTKDGAKQTDAQFVAGTLLDWIAASVGAVGSMPFKDLLEARMALTLGKPRKTRDELMDALGEGFERGKTSSDGTRVWREREAGNLRGTLTVHAIRRDAS